MCLKNHKKYQFWYYISHVFVFMPKVLKSKKPHMVENAGFIRGKDGIIKTYTQMKSGMGYFYAKRKVLDDGVSTTHLDI